MHAQVSVAHLQTSVKLAGTLPVNRLPCTVKLSGVLERCMPLNNVKVLLACLLICPAHTYTPWILMLAGPRTILRLAWPVICKPQICSCAQTQPDPNGGIDHAGCSETKQAAGTSLYHAVEMLICNLQARMLPYVRLQLCMRRWPTPRPL